WSGRASLRRDQIEPGQAHLVVRAPAGPDRLLVGAGVVGAGHLDLLPLLEHDRLLVEVVDLPAEVPARHLADAADLRTLLVEHAHAHLDAALVHVREEAPQLDLIFTKPLGVPLGREAPRERLLLLAGRERVGGAL